MKSNFGLIHQVYSLPELIRQQYEDLEPKTRTILGTPEIFGIRQIIITGCGDSYAAALAVKDAFMELTGLAVEAVPAIELSRTAPDFIFGSSPNNPLVIAVSNSGSVVRMNEAVKRAGSHGAFTLAVTGNRQSELAKSALRVLDLEVPPFEPAPGTRSYVVSLMALLLIAIRIGEVRGRYPMDTAMSMRYDMMAQASQLEELLPDMDSSMKQLAENWMDLEAFDFVGTGMEYGTAWYAHAKVVEQLGRYSFYKNSEDWLHTHIFFRNTEKIGTVIFADSRNPAASRTRETIGYAAQLGRPLLVIGDEKVELPGRSIAAPATEYYMNSCLTQFAPVSLLANYMANLVGEEDGRGCKGVWSIADGARCIRDSRVEIL